MTLTDSDRDILIEYRIEQAHEVIEDVRFFVKFCHYLVKYFSPGLKMI